METTKGIEELKEQLSTFEQDITESISAELVRIGRVIQTDELEYNPFNEDVGDYVKAIRIDGDNSPLLDTSFNDANEKYLYQFISDSEIDHWNLIALLGMLKDIDN